MSLPRKGRRPNRRQTNAASFNVAPLALQFATPGIDAGNTFFTLPLSQFHARVDSQVGGAAVLAITCCGYFDGTFTTKTAEFIRNDGEDGEGTLVTLKFLGVLSNVKPWLLSIPADSPLIQSRFGGRLAGTLNLGESLVNWPRGFVRISNYADVGAPAPVLAAVQSATTDAGNDIDVVTNASGASPWVIASLGNLLWNGGTPPDSYSDLGSGNFRLTFSGMPVPGGTLEMSTWEGTAVGAGGQVLAPFRVVLL